MNKYMSDDYKAGFFGKGSDAQKDAWARYAKAQGLGDLKNYKVIDYRKDGGVEYSYTDESGKTQKKVISQDEWAAVVAAQDADKAVNEAGEKIVDMELRRQMVYNANHKTTSGSNKGVYNCAAKEQTKTDRCDYIANEK